ncbi:MAG: response regulator transcription factor [Chloroflexota bacterium]
MRLRLMGLSPRESEVTLLATRGFLVREIARQLQVAPGTVMTLVARAREKLGCRTVRELAVTLLRMGVVQVADLGGPLDQSGKQAQLQ